MKSDLKKILPILILVLIVGVFLTRKTDKITTPTPIQIAPAIQTQTPQVVSTNPSSLDGSTITPSQSVNITFNIPLQNKDEVKSSVNPLTPYAVSLSGDRKTVTITPVKPYGFSQQYTLKIGKETKFEGEKKLDNDLFFSFRTIDYRGV